MNYWCTRIILLALGLILISSPETKAQRYYFEHYGVEEGLAQSRVFSIIQDASYHVWLGTLGGVSRFDGRKFTNYTTSNGLAPGGVRCIFEDSEGVIWFGHLGGGISRYIDGEFESLQTSLIFTSDVTSINEDREGRVWLSSESSGAIRFIRPERPLTAMSYEHYKGQRLSDRVFKIVRFTDSTLYFITDAGVKRFLEKENNFENMVIPGMPRYFQITTLHEDRSGDIWFGTYHGGLYQFLKHDSTFVVYDRRDGLGSNFVSDIMQDSYGDVWVGTWDGGITRVNGRGLYTFNKNNGLSDNKIYAITEDAEGNILIGTYEHGFSIFKGDRFVSWNREDGLSSSHVNAITRDRNGHYWLGGLGGISIYNPVTKQFRYIHDARIPETTPVNYIKEDRSGNIWIATSNKGVAMVNPRSGKLDFPFELNMVLPPDNIITSMAIDTDNNLWLGTNEGLVYHEIDKKQSQRLTQIHGIAGNQISGLYADSGGRLWVGSEGRGITCIEGNSFKIYRAEEQITPISFSWDPDSVLWVGTQGQGLYTLENDTLTFALGQEQGLLSNLLYVVSKGSDSVVYIGTNKGLNLYYPGSGTIRSFSRKDGFMGIEVKSNAVYKDSEGLVWLGTVSGLTRYNPGARSAREVEPFTRIVSMRDNNMQERIMTPGMQLSYSDNSVFFEYHGISLANPDALVYQVMLEGADAGWSPFSTQTSVNYRSLKPGKYTFKVRARNTHGIWNSEPIAFTFFINPPFYLTWWFIVTCVAFLTAILLVYIKIRERNLITEKRILEEKVRDRTAEVMFKNEELAMKNKDILDSIEYAKRIQFAILPPEIPWRDAFVLFKPKDIVSGDFYWFITDEDIEMMAAVDCTGHGVPGAFMSIIGYNSLNKIVKEYGITRPSEVLNLLNEEVVRTLHQQGQGIHVNDGMDISLVSYHRKSGLLEFAGAFNPLWLVRDAELVEIKADRFSIGRQHVLDKQVNSFTNQEVQLQDGDIIYLFTDGYADQFGGPLSKKFKSRPMKELILSLHAFDIQQQAKTLEDVIESWRGGSIQIDDMLVIGRAFPSACQDSKSTR